MVIIVFIMLELMNIIWMDSALNLLITLPQFFIVLYYIIKGNLSLAFLLHVIFTLTGFNETSASYDGVMYSYAKFKVAGPVALSYINLIFLYYRSKSNLNLDEVETSLFWEFRKVMRLLLVIATSLGVVGMVLWGYRVDDYVTPFAYLCIGYLYVTMFVNLYNKSLLKDCYEYAFFLLVSAPFATFISFFILGIKASYSELDALIFNEEFMMAPTLFLCLLDHTKYKSLIICSLILYLFCVAAAGRGGFFLNISVAIICLLYMVFVLKRGGRFSMFLKFLFPLILVYIFPYIYSLKDANSLAGVKFNDYLSLVETLFSFDINKIDSDYIQASPYTRIAEIVNIIWCGLHNPFALFFGRGFGGQYTDISGMFNSINLDDGGGAFSIVAVRSGRYGYAHSSIPMILLWNGIWGIYLLFKLGFAFFKRIKFSAMYYPAFILFFYGFYFNPSLFLAVAFCLYGAEYKYKYEKE